MKKKALATLLFSSFLLAGCMDVQTDTGDDNFTQDTDTSSELTSASIPENETDESTEAENDHEEVTFKYEVNPTTQAIVPIDENDNPQVALLTFDDAPDGYALEIAEILEEHNAPAIFFVNGMYLESDEGKEALKTIHEMGFEIGNHTYTHVNLQQSSEEVQKEEILSTSDLIEEITGVRPRFFRAPFGVNSEYSKELVKDEGMTLMNWTFGYDWESEYQNAEALAEITLSTPHLSNGANILMHDRSWTKDALPQIIEGLRDQDYELLDSRLIQSPETKEKNDHE